MTTAPRRRPRAPIVLAVLLGAGLVGRAGSVRTADDGVTAVEWIDGADAVIDRDAGGVGVFQPDPEVVLAAEAPQRFRIRVRAAEGRPRLRLSLVSHDAASDRARDRLDGITLTRAGPGRFESPWLVLVAGPEDRNAPELNGLALRAALGDRIEARVRRGAGRAIGESRWAGYRDDQGRAGARLRVRLAATVLRGTPDGEAVIGASASDVRAQLRYQVVVLNEVLAQCGLWAGQPADLPIRIADPPGPALLAVGEPHGFYSVGGVVRLTLDGQRYGPWRMGEGYAPIETARALAHELVDAGYRVTVAQNARNPSAANATADLLVRRPDGSLAELAPWADAALTTDPRQPLSIGSVSLDDGLEPYGANELFSGTLEERALIRPLAADDPAVISLFVINRFAGQLKQGESFARDAGQAIGDAVILDWRALARARQAYTLPHEIGHVLLGDLGHPDGRGDRRPWLLMNSRSSSAVGGPRRIPPAACAAMRERLAARASPSS